MKIEKKKEVFKMRKEGYSLGEISTQFGISKSTAFLWTKGIVFSNKGAIRMETNKKLSRNKGHEILRQRKKGRLIKAEEEAEKVILEARDDKFLKIAVLSMIYQCEGAKDTRTLCFANSDPDMIKLFLKLFRTSFVIDKEKLRALVHIHDYHNEQETKVFWSSVTEIPLDKFYKSFQKPSKHLYKNYGYRGCIHIYYHDAHVLRVILAFAKKLMNLYI